MEKFGKLAYLFCLSALALVFALLAAGCSSRDNRSFQSYDRAEKEDYFAMYEMDYDYGMAAGGEASYEMLATSKAMESANLPAARKIIRDADMTVESEGVEASYENILALLSGFGGYESGREMYSNSYGYPIISATLKVPADKLDTFLAEIKKEGEVKSSSITSSDITDQYYDAKIRLETLEKTLENYYVFLENAADVDEQLEVTRYINDVTYSIEQLKGSIKRWDSLVEYSTVALYLYPINETPEEPRVIEWNSLSLDDMGWFISSGFLGVCNAIFSVLQWIVISVVTLLPILLPLALVIFLLARRHKKKKMQKQAQNQNNIQPQG